MKQPLELFAEVEKLTDATKQKLQSKLRYSNLVAARILFYKLAIAEGYTKSSIARHLHRDHTTIIHYARKINEQQKTGI